jgi:hypothetical protein
MIIGCQIGVQKIQVPVCWNLFMILYKVSNYNYFYFLKKM